MRFAADHPQDLRGAIDRLDAVATRYPGAAWEQKARQEEKRLQGEIDGRASASLQKIESEATKLAASGAYGEAIDGYRRFLRKNEGVAGQAICDRASSLRNEIVRQGGIAMEQGLEKARALALEGKYQESRAEIDRVAAFGLPPYFQQTIQKAREKLDDAVATANRKESDRALAEGLNRVRQAIAERRFAEAGTLLDEMLKDARLSSSYGQLKLERQHARYLEGIPSFLAERADRLKGASFMGGTIESISAEKISLSRGKEGTAGLTLAQVPLKDTAELVERAQDRKSPNDCLATVAVFVAAGQMGEATKELSTVGTVSGLQQAMADYYRARIAAETRVAAPPAEQAPAKKTPETGEDVSKWPKKGPGSVAFSNGIVVVESKAGGRIKEPTCVVKALNPDAEYTFSAEARRDKGPDGFMIPFEAFGKNLAWIVGGYGRPQDSWVAGFDFKTNKSIAIENGRWHKVQIEVNKRRAVGYLDGEQVWTLSLREVDRPRPVVERFIEHDFGGVGVGVAEAQASFRNITLKIQE